MALYFCHPSELLVASEGSPVSPCICCGLCLGVIMDNKIISNGQEDSSSNQVGKLPQCQTEKCPLRLSGNEVHSAGTQGAPVRDLHQNTMHLELRASAIYYFS